MVVTVSCPVTGQNQRAALSDRIEIKGQAYNWWYCGHCRDWHVFSAQTGKNNQRKPAEGSDVLRTEPGGKVR